MRTLKAIVKKVISKAPKTFILGALVRVFIRDLLKIQVKPASNIVFCTPTLFKQSKKRGQIL